MPDLDKKQLSACYFAARAFARDVAESGIKSHTARIDQAEANNSAFPGLLKDRPVERERPRQLSPVDAGKLMRTTRRTIANSWEMSALTAAFINERLPDTPIQFLAVHQPINHTILVIGARPPCRNLADMPNYTNNNAYVVDSYCGILCALSEYPEILRTKIALWRDPGRPLSQTDRVGENRPRDPTEWVSDVVLSRISGRSPDEDGEEEAGSPGSVTTSAASTPQRRSATSVLQPESPSSTHTPSATLRTSRRKFSG
jgi:hypothetical protein